LATPQMAHGTMTSWTHTRNPRHNTQTVSACPGKISLVFSHQKPTAQVLKSNPNPSETAVALLIRISRLGLRSWIGCNPGPSSLPAGVHTTPFPRPPWFSGSDPTLADATLADAKIGKHVAIPHASGPTHNATPHIAAPDRRTAHGDS